MSNAKIKVSIIILTYNAPRYVKITLDSIITTTEIDYEIIVVDNASRIKTKKILLNYFNKGVINKLLFLDENTFFAKGNNIGSKLCDINSTHILLLNSDIKVNNKDWLKVLVNSHKKGATSFGITVNEPVRADGFCFLIDKEIYLNNLLDENYEWWWSVTKLQGVILREGYSIQSFINHDEYLYHYGGRSKMDLTKVKGLDIDMTEVNNWFKDKKVEQIDLGSKIVVSALQKKIRKLTDIVLNK